MAQRPPLDGSVWPDGDLKGDQNMLLQTWRFNGTHRSGRDPRLAPLTCRLYHVCQFSDGSLLLPESMRKLERTVKACGVKGYVFANQASLGTAFDHSHGMADLVSSSLPPDSNNADGQLLFITQIIFGQYVSSEAQSSETIDYRVYTKLDSENLTKEEAATPLKPLLYVQQVLIDTAAEMTEDDEDIKESWESLAIEKLKTSMKEFEVHGMDDAFPGRHRDVGDPSSSRAPQAVCYYSVMSTGEAGDELPKKAMGKDNPFFEHNNISRTERWLMREASGSSREGENGSAKKRVRKDDGFLNLLIVRDGISAVDQAQIEEGLVLRLKKLGEGANFKLELSVVRLKGSADVALMYTEFQRADVVIAAKSPALNNVLYMRSKAFLVEIYPFSMGVTTHRKVADTLGVYHLGIMALADTEVFQRCVENGGGGSENGAKGLMEAWNAAAAKFKTGNRKSYLDFHSRQSAWGSNSVARKCVSEQTLKLISTDPVVRAVFDRAILPRLST